MIYGNVLHTYQGHRSEPNNRNHLATDKEGQRKPRGAWLAVKLKEWVEMEKEFKARVADGTMPQDATMRQRSDGMVAGGLLNKGTYQ